MDRKSWVASNKLAWSTGVYDARCEEYGKAEDAAREMVENPEYFLRHFRHVLGDLPGKRVLNLLGSHARKAVPMALLGVDVTVVDISEENRRYGMETAEAAGVDIKYEVIDAETYLNQAPMVTFDLCLMEGGCLHYFQDLVPLYKGVARVLSPDGRFVVHEFHPFRKIRHVNDYFFSGVHEVPVPVRSNNEGPRCRLRYRTMAEIWREIVDASMRIELFEEQPHWEDPTVPGFILLKMTA